MLSGDTIAAISSATGPAARMIVRASGADALRIASHISPHASLDAGAASHAILHFADLQVPAWVYVFRAPRSYTGEDGVEFHIPGNPVLARLLLQTILHGGARLADPGEFTARAFLNGRLDLTEAEGVAATIAANSERELSAARQLLAGELARRLAPSMDAIAQTLALVEVGIDFSDEQVSFISPDQISRQLLLVDQALKHLLADSARFEQLSHEPLFILVGRPNVGKSTLFNALAGRQRAVTSAVAGTTRDALTAEISLARGIVRLMDVAGLDESPHPLAAPSANPQRDGMSESPAVSAAMDGSQPVQHQVEQQMQQQALRAIESADFLLLVRDITDVQPAPHLPRPADLTILSKSDLLVNPRAVHSPPTAIQISAITGCNIESLREKMDDLAFGAAMGTTTLALNTRHVALVEQARAALGLALHHAQQADAPEVLALDLREALTALGGILGQLTPDDLLGKIFANFCIGK